MSVQELPRHFCHKEVRAVKITYVDERAKQLHFDHETYSKLDVSQEYLDKYNPAVGGYYVIYDDGYESYSPEEAFEKGYVSEAEMLETLGQDRWGQFFVYGHLREDLKPTSEMYARMAYWVLKNIPSDAQQTVAMNHLKVSKDAAVCAHLSKFKNNSK